MIVSKYEIVGIRKNIRLVAICERQEMFAKHGGSVERVVEGSDCCDYTLLVVAYREKNDRLGE